MTRNCGPDSGLIRRNGNAVEATLAQRPTAVELHAAPRDHRAVLAQADDRVVATVRHVEVGPFFQRGIAGPVGITLFVRDWGQIDRMVERLRAEATHRRYPEDHAVVYEVDRRDRVFKWLAHIQNPRGRIVEDHTKPRRGTVSVFIVVI